MYCYFESRFSFQFEDELESMSSEDYLEVEEPQESCACGSVEGDLFLEFLEELEEVVEGGDDLFLCSCS